MDWIADLVDLVEAAGFVGAISILTLIALITVVVMFTKRMEGLTSAITILSDKVSSPYMGTSLSLKLFRSVMENHVSKKLSYLGGVLRANSIQERRKQIEKNIEREFKKITNEEAEILSEYKSVCGDMGKILTNNINWENFLEKVYSIFFTNVPKDKTYLKIQDLKILMNGEVDQIIRIIEDNGAHN